MSAGLYAQAPQPGLTVNQVVDRIIEQEQTLIKQLEAYHPYIETYIQNLTADQELGSIPTSDRYFLSRLDFKSGVHVETMVASGSAKDRKSVEFLPDGFAGMVLIDPSGIGRKTYTFEFVRREFLGAVRCLVFSIRPIKPTPGRFTGQIWVEDQEYSIVRFSGIHGPAPKVKASQLFFHCDSWRQNAGPNLWLPAYVYAEESVDPRLNFKSQTRLWGYAAQKHKDLDEFTAVLVESDTAKDVTDPQNVSPLMATRAWQRQAEDNIIHRFEETGLLAAGNDVNKILETVVRNLIITNKLSVDEVRARVLLTSPLESFNVGNTIVLSRGLIDVLPDEASLAAVLAHELAHIASGHNPQTRYSFGDSMAFDDVETFKKLFVRRDEKEEAEADSMAAGLLRNSPYAERLASAGLFLRAMDAHARQLPGLLHPHMGNSMVANGAIVRMTGLMASAPQLEKANIDQIAALPLGARLRLDPWDNTVQMATPTPMPLKSAREKMPFEITPVFLYLTRVKADSSRKTVDAGLVRPPQ
jgi:hypothetical protein